MSARKLVCMAHGFVEGFDESKLGLELFVALGLPLRPRTRTWPGCAKAEEPWNWRQAPTDARVEFITGNGIVQFSCKWQWSGGKFSSGGTACFEALACGRRMSPHGPHGHRSRHSEVGAVLSSLSGVPRGAWDCVGWAAACSARLFLAQNRHGPSKDTRCRGAHLLRDVFC